MVYYGVAKKTFKEKLLESEPEKQRTRAVTVRLPQEVDQELQQLAQKSGRTYTDVVVEALKYALELSDK